MKQGGDASLESVIATDQLATRPAGAPDLERETRALLELAEEMGQPSRHVLQRVAEVAMDLCAAGSAGVSILEDHDGKERVRWYAVAGALRDNLWSLPPQESSASSIAIERNAVQLFIRPARHFGHLSELKPPILETLVAPFDVDGRPGGTIWLASHEREQQFNAGSARVLADLARVAGWAYHAHCLVEGMRDSNRRKDEFLAVLSHELRNPLAAISNSLKYLVSTTAAGGDQARAHGVMHRQLAQVIRLSDDLLDVSRIGHGTLELRRDRTDLVNAVRLAREAANPALEEFGREIVMDLPDAPIWVEGDPARLSQIATNLLTNTARRTRSGGQVTLALHADGNEAVMVVSGDSERIATGWVPADRLRRGAAATESAPEAQGIGLTLARDLTEMHGGRVATVSTDGRTENGFEVRFPLLDGADHTLTERTEHKADGRSVREPRRRQKVLIVDDSVDASDSLALLLRGWGYDVRTAQGATAGLRLEWEFEPHAVILDIEMPGKNGYEVAAELRVRRRRDLLLVALSGHAREEDRTRSLEAGFDHHLTKPANVDMLRRLLSR